LLPQNPAGILLNVRPPFDIDETRATSPAQAAFSSQMRIHLAAKAKHGSAPLSAEQYE